MQSKAKGPRLREQLLERLRKGAQVMAAYEDSRDITANFMAQVALLNAKAHAKDMLSVFAEVDRLKAELEDARSEAQLDGFSREGSGW